MVELNRQEFIWKLADYLGCFEDEIVRFKVLAWVIWVHVKGNRPTFISRKSFASMVRRDAEIMDGMIDYAVREYQKQQGAASKRIKSRRKPVKNQKMLTVSREGKKHPLLAHLPVAK